MKRSALLLLATVTGAALVGCREGNKRAEEAPSPAMSGQQSPQPAKTISWFIERPSELQATLKACRDNPGALGKTPDCVNASAARDKITVQEMKDALK